MSHVIVVTLRFLLRQIAFLVLIVCVLVAGSFLKSEWDRLEELREQVAANRAVLENLRVDLASTEAEAERLASEWRKQIETRTRPLLEALASLEARIGPAEIQWLDAVGKFTDLERQTNDARRAADDARAQVSRLDRDLYFWDRLFNPGKLVELEAARLRHRALAVYATAWQQARDRVAPTFERSPVDSLRKLQTERRLEIERIGQSVSPRYEELEARRRRLSADVGKLGNAVAQQSEDLAQRLLGKLRGAAQKYLPVALAILAGALAVPLLIKALFYFVIAPLAGRLRPIRILPGAQATAIPAPPASAVSVALDIDAGDELLVQADFLQSSSRTARKRTQWFLNPRLPFASLASGMYALTRIRPEGAQVTRVVLSSQHDAFGEVTVVELPAGASVVLTPRSLAGVAKPAGSPLRISRHWRLGSLHAWLTLQLRYLVFHGPCRLVLKGCRGVRAEQPDPGQPRLINQSATLGFSANLEYQTARCETFVSYLRGQEDLFNDLFGGGPGWFFYEERPSDGRRTGVTGRGLEGLTDAALKALGI
ncbi:MAG: hypothetical protein ABIQ06_05800 [Caldimonas sp.]